MSEYWVSRDKYFCKYCKIFIADDKPSRIQHETGLKHKGNYERFIRDIYKRGEKDARDKAEEAREMARIEAAAQLAMGTSGASSSPAPSASSSRKTPPAPTDKFANYSTAESLGFVEDPEVEIRRVEEEERKKEGRIGEWERVSVVKPKVVPARVEGEREGEERKPDLEGEEREKAEDEEKEEEDRPTQRRWLKEKTAVSTEDEWDPTKVAPLKLKRKILTLREEEALREEEERVKRAKKDAEKEKRRREKAAVTKAGWQEVELTEEPLLEFDEPEVEQTEDGEGEAGDEVRPKVEEDVKPTSGFKKRKMFGAGAAKRR